VILRRHRSPSLLNASKGIPLLNSNKGIPIRKLMCKPPPYPVACGGAGDCHVTHVELCDTAPPVRATVVAVRPGRGPASVRIAAQCRS
jgi:hypothetical protein